MKLQNGSQVEERPTATESSGTPGYFAESNNSGEPSYPGKDWFNNVIDEFINSLTEAGVAYDSSKLTNLASAFVKLKEDSTSKANTALGDAKTDASTKDVVVLTTAKAYADAQIRSIRLLDVNGTGDDIILTTPATSPAVTTLNDYDEFSFIVSATNTSSTVTIKIDELDAVTLSGISSDTQIFETALLTVRYIDGAFYIAEQINPKTGNSVADIAKLIPDTTDILYPGEYALNGFEINSIDHPIGCAKASATSNYIAQAIKDSDPIEYGGYYGFVIEDDGSTTVTLPTVGGDFIRMFDDGRGVDVDRVFGSWQEDEFESHTHTYTRKRSEYSVDNGSYQRSGNGVDTLDSGATGGDETRPRNIAYYGKTRL